MSSNFTNIRPVSVSSVREALVKVYEKQTDKKGETGGGIEVTVSMMRVAEKDARDKGNSNLADAIRNIRKSVQNGTADLDKNGKLQVTSPSTPNAPESELVKLAKRDGSKALSKKIDNGDFEISTDEETEETDDSQTINQNRMQQMFRFMMMIMMFMGGGRQGMFR